MALIDLNRKEIQCKIVYYGPGRSGKTTNLIYISNAMKDKTEGKLLTVETKDDKILFFDLFLLRLGKVNDFDIKIQLYTVPGQTCYEATRKLVLKGVDGVVFVADSLRVRRDRNKESLEDLRKNLIQYQIDIRDIPLVFQYNKRDLVDSSIPTLTIEELQEDLNAELGAKYFEAVAIKGIGVFETLKEISKKTIHYVALKYLLKKK